MRFIQIPKTDLNVSRVCLGTAEFGARIKVEDAPYLLDAFVEAGGTFIDTAHVYSDWVPGEKSRSEKTIGKWLTKTGLRNQLIIATKGAHPLLSSMNVSRLSPSDITQDVNESLEYLQTDTIDLYWLHRDDVNIPVDGIIDALVEQVNVGKIRYFACSNWKPARIQEALDYSASKGIPSFVGNQPMWSLAVADMTQNADQTVMALDDEGFAFHQRTGMALLPFSSQAKGFFPKFAAGGVDAVKNMKLYYSDVNIQRAERAIELAKRYGVPVNDVALAYVMHQPFVTVPIVGPHSIEQIQSSMNAVNLTLTAEDMAYLEGR